MAEVMKPGATSGESEVLEETLSQYSEFKRTLTVFFGRPFPVIGLAIILIFVVITIIGPWIAPHDPSLMDVLNKLKGPSADHWLGTDSLGRDVLSRIIFAARTSMIIGLSVISISAVAGVLLGLVAAYFGGLMGNIIMRITDGLMAFPGILLALMVASLIGSGMVSVIIALTISMLAPMVRVTSGIAMSVKQNDYVLSARTLGAGSFNIMLTEILPNCFAPILVMMTMGIGATILAEAGLSFLGVGITPPTMVWGRMVNEGYPYLLIAPVLSVAPGLAVMLVVFGFNMMGDGLRDALDPRLRGVI